jgi:hypothetical protein
MTNRPIESVHGGFDPLRHPDRDGLSRQDQGIIDQSPLCVSKTTQDEVGCIDAVLVSDPDPETGKLFGSEVAGDIAQAFLTAIGPPWPKSQLADGQAEIVANHQDVLERQFIEPRCLTDRTSAEIHERLGFQEENAAKVDLDFGELAVELVRERRLRPTFCEAFDQLESDIVSCSLVLAARVAQAGYQFHHRQRPGSQHAFPGLG